MIGFAAETKILWSRQGSLAVRRDGAFYSSFERFTSPGGQRTIAPRPARAKLRGRSAKLHGALTIEELSQDHLLFAAVFKATPSITIDYFCEILP